MRQCLQLFYDFLYFLIYNQIVTITFSVVDEIECVFVHVLMLLDIFPLSVCFLALYHKFEHFKITVLKCETFSRRTIRLSPNTYFAYYHLMFDLTYHLLYIFSAKSEKTILILFFQFSGTSSQEFHFLTNL